MEEYLRTLRETISGLNAMIDYMKTETGDLLEAGEIEKISALTLSFGGQRVDIPMDIPEVNFQVLSSLREIMEAVKEEAEEMF